MSNFFDVAENRKSTRQFTTDQVPKDQLIKILEAGSYAPSGMGKKAWHFSAVQNPQLLKQLSDLPEMKASGFYNAPTIVIVSVSSESVTPLEDSVLALGTMLLAAQDLNIDSCWIHSIPLSLNNASHEELKKQLEIPEGNKVYTAAAFGYRADKTTTPTSKAFNNFVIV